MPTQPIHTGRTATSAFCASLLPQLRRLVAYDSASVNEISVHERRARITAVDPLDGRANADEQLLATLAHQNPLVAAADRDRGAEARTSIARAGCTASRSTSAVYAPREIGTQMPSPS